MPRPNQPRTIGAEERLRANVLRLLDDRERSIPWLSRKMGAAGCPMGSASLWKSLRQDRRIVVDEALAIAGALGVSLTELLAVGDVVADGSGGAAPRHNADRARHTQDLGDDSPPPRDEGC